jgi:hypothetical protein
LALLAAGHFLALYGVCLFQAILNTPGPGIVLEAQMAWHQTLGFYKEYFLYVQAATAGS